MSGDQEIVLKAANKLHANLQTALEKPDNQGHLDSQDQGHLDSKVKVNPRKKVIGGWYQKPTDTCTIPNFGSAVPLQNKRYVIEGTVYRVFRSTSTKKKLNEALGAD